MKEFFDSLLVDFKERYRNRMLFPAIIFVLAYQWKIVVLFFYVNEFKYVEFKNQLIENYVDFEYIAFFHIIVFISFYNFALPWINYVIEYIRQKPIYLSKALILKNESILEVQRLSTARVTQERLRVEANNEFVTSGKQDVATYERKYLQNLSSTTLNEIIDELSKGYISHNNHTKIYNFVICIDEISNQFNSPIVIELDKSLASLISDIYEQIKNLKSGQNPLGQPVFLIEEANIPAMIEKFINVKEIHQKITLIYTQLKSQ